MSTTSAQSALSALKLQKRTLRRTISKKLAEISDERLEEQSRAIANRILAYPAVQKCRSISCYLNMPTGEVRTEGLVERLIELGKTIYVPKIIPIPRPTLSTSTTPAVTSSTLPTPPTTPTTPPPTTMDFFHIPTIQDLHSIKPAGLWGIREPGDMTLDGELRRRVLYYSDSDMSPPLTPMDDVQMLIPAPVTLLQVDVTTTPPLSPVDIPATGAEMGTADTQMQTQSLAELDVILLPGVAFDTTLSRLGHGKGYYDRFIAEYVASGRKKPMLIGLALSEQVLDLEGGGGEGGLKVPVGKYDCKLDVLVWPGGVLESERES